MNDIRAAWEQTISKLETKMPATSVQRFLKPLVPASFDGNTAEFHAPGRFVKEWVEDRYLDIVTQNLSDSLEMEVRIEIQVKPNEHPGRASKTAGAVSVQSESSLEAPSAGPSFQPNPRYRFETFVVGQSSRLAYAGCKAVAEKPAQKYNPLFIYGPSGLGKTHLLHSIANEILMRDPNYPVMYISAQQFTEDFIHALQNNRIEQFRRQQRNVGVWLLDDVQSIAGKDHTQEELFHTFNYLQQFGKQIVLCSDRPPRDLLLMEERLRSRFEAGLVADIQMPNTETRCAIVLKKAEQESIHIDHEIAMCLSEGISGSVRTLEGALTKLAAHASMDGSPITLELAQEIVEKDYINTLRRKPSFQQILDQVSNHYRIPSDDILGISRKQPIAFARHVTVYVTRRITGDSWKHIGELFGGRDHTSMMHGYKKIEGMLARDKEMHASVNMLIQDLYPDQR